MDTAGDTVVLLRGYINLSAATVQDTMHCIWEFPGIRIVFCGYGRGYGSVAPRLRKPVCVECHYSVSCLSLRPCMTWTKGDDDKPEAKPQHLPVVDVPTCLDGPQFSKVDSIFILCTLSGGIGGGGPWMCLPHSLYMHMNSQEQRSMTVWRIVLLRRILAVATTE